MKLSIAILAFSFNLTTINPSRHLDQDGVIGALDLLLNGVLANAMDAESVFHGYTGGWPVELHDATVHHIKLVRAAAWMTEDLPELTAEVLAVITPLVTLVSRTEVAFAENVAYTRSWFEEAGACEYMHDAIERLQNAVHDLLEGLSGRLPRDVWVGSNAWKTVTGNSYMFEATTDSLAPGACINKVNPR